MPLCQGITTALFGLLAQAALRGTAFQQLDFGPTKYVHFSVILRLNDIGTPSSYQSQSIQVSIQVVTFHITKLASSSHQDGMTLLKK